MNRLRRWLKKLPWKRSTESPVEDPALKMSQKELLAEVLRLRGRNHEIADQWSKRYGQLLQDLASKEIALYWQGRIDNTGWEYLKKNTEDEKHGWSHNTRYAVGLLIKQAEMSAEMVRVKDKLLAAGRKLVAKLDLHEARSDAERGVVQWMRHTAAYTRPILESDSNWSWVDRFLEEEAGNDEGSYLDPDLRAKLVEWARAMKPMAHNNDRSQSDSYWERWEIERKLKELIAEIEAVLVQDGQDD